MRIAMWLAVLATIAASIVLAGDFPDVVRIAALLVTLFPLGLWIAVRRPVVIYSIYAFSLGAVPFAVLPSSPLPLALLLAVAIGATAVIQLPSRPRRPSPLEWAMLALVVTSAISLLVTVSTRYDLLEFAKWLIATSVVFALARLHRPELHTVGRWYVVGTALGSLSGLAMLLFDRSGESLSLLSFLGYGTAEGTNLRYVVGDAGLTVRLTGTYTDPNAGGLFLYLGAALALALFRGVQRVVLTGLIVVAMLLTLSRAALFSFAIAFLIVIAIQNMRVGGRFRLLGLALVGGAGALAIPQVNSRLFESFGTGDEGTSARLEALRDFPKHMDGNWLFGLGWGRLEFRDGEVGMAVNHVANAPLLSVYRGGVLVGLCFVVVLVIGLVLSYRALRRGDLGDGFLGAAFVGFAVVALQVDFPVVTIPPVAALFATFLAFLPREDDPPEGVATAALDTSQEAMR